MLHISMFFFLNVRTQAFLFVTDLPIHIRYYICLCHFEVPHPEVKINRKGFYIPGEKNPKQLVPL